MGLLMKLLDAVVELALGGVCDQRFWGIFRADTTT